MLPSRVSVPVPPNPETEDIFSSALSLTFTDDTQNSHGTPGQSVSYASPKYGEIKLGIPQYPGVEEGRKLFAHYLWNAGVVVADAVEKASNDTTSEEILGDRKVTWDQSFWDVRNTNVLELGAGTGLPSIICALSGAKRVTITDHPSSPALITDTIAHNVLANLNINLLSTSTSPATPPESPRTTTQIQIHGLTWGDDLFTSSTTYGKPSTPQPAANSFDKIIIADCLWMPSQHANLVTTINSYLRHSQQEQDSERELSYARQQDTAKIPCALVVAGFHTGRYTVARFFEVATGSPNGNGASADTDSGNTGDQQEQVDTMLTAAEIFEVDVDCNVRLWQPERLGESKEQAKRWCVCAALVRR